MHVCPCHNKSQFWGYPSFSSHLEASTENRSRIYLKMYLWISINWTQSWWFVKGDTVMQGGYFSLFPWLSIPCSALVRRYIRACGCCVIWLSLKSELAVCPMPLTERYRHWLHYKWLGVIALELTKRPTHTDMSYIISLWNSLDRLELHRFLTRWQHFIFANVIQEVVFLIH